MRLLLSLLFVAPLLLPARPAASPQAGGSKIWLERHGEVVSFLQGADIVRLEDIGSGVTRPKRAFFAAGGLAGSAIVKDVDQGFDAPRLDSFRAEIAAYEIDRLLDLDMVPPTVCRRFEGERRSVQLWVENCRLLKKMANERAPDVAWWNQQVHRMRVFDNLIANVDRHAGNILVDPDWNIVLIDHSRAFDTRNRALQYAMTRVDRGFFERLKGLDRELLRQRVAPWVRCNVDDILARRDEIVRAFEKLIAERGEENVIIG